MGLNSQLPSDAVSLFEPENPKEIFTNLEEIGRGNFGAVYQATNKAGDTLAVKVMKVTKGFGSEEWGEIHKEIVFFKSISHPNIVTFYGCYRVELEIWLSMEYCVGSAQDVMEALKRGLTEDEIGMITQSVLQALAYLHGESKMHRDLKAGNILLTQDGTVKLADFGSATSKCPANSFSGSPFWMAPEMIVAFEAGKYTEVVDIWSLGITAMELANKVPPHFQIHAMSALYHIPQKPAPRLEGDWSDDFKNFVASCLQKEPSDRPSAKELLKNSFVTAERPKTALVELVSKATSPALIEENRQQLEGAVREVQSALNAGQRKTTDESEVSMSDTDASDSNVTSSMQSLKIDPQLSGSTQSLNAQDDITPEATKDKLPSRPSSADAPTRPRTENKQEEGPKTPTKTKSAATKKSNNSSSPPRTPTSTKSLDSSQTLSPAPSSAIPTPTTPVSPKVRRVASADDSSNTATSASAAAKASPKKASSAPVTPTKTSGKSPRVSKHNKKDNPPSSPPSASSSSSSFGGAGPTSPRLRKKTTKRRKAKVTGLQVAREERVALKEAAASKNAETVSQLKQIKKIRKEQAKTLENLQSKHTTELDRIAVKDQRELDSITRAHEKEFEKVMSRCRSETEQFNKEEATEKKKFLKKEKERKDAEIAEHTKDFAARLKVALSALKADTVDVSRDERKMRQHELKDQTESARMESEKKLLEKFEAESQVRLLEFNLARLKLRQEMELSHLNEEFNLFEGHSKKLVECKKAKMQALNVTKEHHRAERARLLDQNLQTLTQMELQQAESLKKEALKDLSKRHATEQRVHHPREMKAEQQRRRSQFRDTVRRTKKTSKETRNSVHDPRRHDEEKVETLKQLESEYLDGVSEMIKESTHALTRRHREEMQAEMKIHQDTLAGIKSYQKTRMKTHEAQAQRTLDAQREDKKKRMDKHQSFIEQQAQILQNQRNCIRKAKKRHETELAEMQQKK